MASRAIAAVPTFIAAALLAAAPALAQQSRDWKACTNRDNAVALDVAINACTDLIQSGRQKPINLYAALISRGIAHHDRKEYDSAVADYTAAIQLDGNETAAFNNRGNSYKAKGDLQRALTDFSEAIRRDPRKPMLYFNRAMAYAARGDLDRAIHDLNEAIRLNPQNADYFDVLGMIFEAKGDNERAQANFIAARRFK